VVVVDDVDVPGARGGKRDLEGGAAGVADVTVLPVALVCPALDLVTELGRDVDVGIGCQRDGQRGRTGRHFDAVGVVVDLVCDSAYRVAGRGPDAHGSYQAEVTWPHARGRYRLLGRHRRHRRVGGRRGGGRRHYGAGTAAGRARDVEHVGTDQRPRQADGPDVRLVFHVELVVLDGATGCGHSNEVAVLVERAAARVPMRDLGVGLDPLLAAALEVLSQPARHQAGCEG